jgi:hypothetical protein
MRHSVIIAMAVVCGFIVCAEPPPPPEPEEPPPLPEPTAEEAKAALVDLIRSPNSGVPNAFSLESLEECDLHCGDGFAYWGPFCLHLKKRDYTYTIAFGRPPRVCRWYYRGKFELKEGRWVALKPEVEMQALGPE